LNVGNKTSQTGPALCKANEPMLTISVAIPANLTTRMTIELYTIDNKAWARMNLVRVRMKITMNTNRLKKQNYLNNEMAAMLITRSKEVGITSNLAVREQSQQFLL
jgi:hypothetical protein